ncbi:hypothetical protein NM208_g7180 [Fusarium decemcellulare]|uniref:Uncharacterized protein n=1 Tax=Fusarium decemcellulare TaxID=57161 RepID=A0ACC1SAA4_9HYPO|nr:hypothetical protein NM208_g7180 [Fusarium decemcellulare]
MPQKRNPMVLERIRGLAGSAVGWSASQLGAMHTATSTDVDQSYIQNPLPGQCAETAGAIALLREVMATVQFDLPAMRKSAGQHWSTASAVADALVASHGLSFRHAHESVAQLIASHERAGIFSGDLCADLITDPALKEYSHSQIHNILDPESFVASRISSGGTSVVARDRLAAIAKTDLLAMEERLQNRISHVAESLEQLLQDARSIVEQPP